MGRKIVDHNIKDKFNLHKMEEAEGGTYFSKIEIPDHVKYLKFKTWINRNECVYKIIKFTKMKKEWEWDNGWHYFLFDENNNSYEVEKFEDIYILSEEEYNRYEERKREMKNKMKDIDPYGEEDWIIKENRIIKKFKIFEQNLELDPYGEEDWEDEDINLTTINNNTIINIGDKIYYHYCRNGHPIIIGKVIDIIKSKKIIMYVLRKLNGAIRYRSRNDLMGCGARVKNRIKNEN